MRSDSVHHFFSSSTTFLSNAQPAVLTSFTPPVHFLSPLSSHILSTVFHLATGLPFAPGSAAVQCRYSKKPEVSASMAKRV